MLQGSITNKVSGAPFYNIITMNATKKDMRHVYSLGKLDSISPSKA